MAYIFRYIKVPARFQFADDCLGSFILRVIQNGKLRILHFVSQRESKDEDLHDWHSKKDQHGSLVPPEMEEFFLDEKEKLVHALHVCPLCLSCQLKENIRHVGRLHP